MKTIKQSQQDPPELRRGQKAQAAFTMVEIAICLAIVAFAMVVIMGVLPAGMQVQRNNREDTLINLDGSYFLEAIRSGAQGMDDLTNYVDAITLRPVNTAARTYTNLTGRAIIGLLSTPRYVINPAANGQWETNLLGPVTARVRALSGSAAEKGRQNRQFAFGYQLESEILPASENYNGLTGTNLTQWLSGATNTYEARLVLRWPIRPDGTVGNNKQTLRVLLTGNLIYMTVTNSLPWWFFQSSQYGQN